MESTVRHLYLRQHSRASNGHYKKSPKFSLLVFLFIMVSYLIFTAAFYGRNGFKMYLNYWKEWSFAVISFPLLLFIVYRITILVKSALFLLVLFTLSLVAISFVPDVNGQFEWNLYALAVFLVLEMIVLIVFLCMSFLFPILVIYLTRNDPTIYWKVSRDPHRKDVYTFKEPFSIYTKQFTYRGELDNKARPHGIGTLSCHWKDGEVLSGNWQHGLPIGPFTSRETQTGFGFQNLRIGFFTITDTFTSTLLGLSESSILKFGVAGVEVSISGRFFADLPRASLIESVNPFVKKNADQSVEESMKELVHLDQFRKERSTGHDVKLTLIATSTGFQVPGYRPILSDSDSAKQLSVEWNSNTHFNLKEWIPKPVELEAVLFIPGFNITVEKSICCFGQMIGLGQQLPSNYKPIVFHWPGGHLLQYSSAITVSKSPELTDLLTKVFKELSESGIKKVHILAHSMAARIVLTAATSFDQSFLPLSKPRNNQNIKSDEVINETRMQLSSVSLVNSEVPLGEFLAEFDQIRMFCDLITIYGNKDDFALFLGELLNGQKMLGRRIDRLERREKTVDLESGPLLNQSFRTLLDVDVIDATTLDNNIRFDRHSYFSVNKLVVDDLMDLITTLQRASGRKQRLLNTKGNVYSFISAPSFVVQG